MDEHAARRQLVALLGDRASEVLPPVGAVSAVDLLAVVEAALDAHDEGTHQ